MASNSRHGQPRAKRYLLTPRSKRPVAFIHPHTGKMVIFTPEKPPQPSASSLNNMSAMSDPIFDTSNILLPPDEDLTQSSPLMNNSAQVMMGAMISSNTFGDYMQTQNIGPIEAFFPTLSSDAFLGEDSDFSGEFFEDDGESNLRIEDFIQFDRNPTDEVDPADQLFDMSVPPPPMTSDDLFLDLDTGLPDDDDLLTPLAGTPMGPPAPATSSRRMSFIASSSICADDEHDDNDNDNDNVNDNDNNDNDDADNETDNKVPPLLAHFGKNSDAVGAFRRNQINQQLIYSNKATAESLAFSGPYTMGTLRGIKHGSFSAVATPITPPRRPKQRQSISGFSTAANDFGGIGGSSSNNAAAQEQAPQKRKASNAVSDALHHHKRPRSISELNNIFL